MTTGFLFLLLFVCMLLGMPVAVALGLSSLLTILFFAQDSLASLSLKLFETSEHYTLAGDPVLHPRWRLHDHRRCCQAHDPLRQQLHRPPARRPGDGLGDGLHAVRRGLGFIAGHRGRGGLDRHCRHGQGRLPAALCRRRDLQRRHAGHPDPALDRDGGLRCRHRNLGRQAVHGRRHTGHPAWPDADGGDLLPCPPSQPAQAAARLGRRGAGARAAIRCGACC